MATSRLIIMTEVSLTPIALVKRLALSLARKLKHRTWHDYPLCREHAITGHYAVTRSLLQGLGKLGVKHEYNPLMDSSVRGDVIVLSDVHALSQAIEAKRAGRVRRLLAGPNVMVLPSEHTGLLESPEIDVIIVPSDWVRIAYEEDSPALKGRISIWPAGIDEGYWKPIVSLKERAGNTALIYVKGDGELLYDETQRVLTTAGWETKTIEYGHYRADQFRESLSGVRLAVFLSRSESQSLALAEAWAMDVPTLVWDPGKLTYNGRDYTTVSSCPYLSERTGKRWRTMTELTELVKDHDKQIAGFGPRDWVLEEMTDEKTSARLLNILRDL